jgi:transposase-like protein
MVPSPLAGVHYPRSIGEFQAWFRSDADCLDYLAWLRWPDVFVCPSCAHAKAWELADGRYECPECGERTSVTAGTIFDRTRTPLTVWFTACWLFATQKDGISALSLKRSLEIGSYQTAWAMLHRLRSVLVRPGRERLQGAVEVDETYIGGEEPGLTGGRAKGKEVLVGVAVERVEPKGFGRCRMVPLADVSAESLRRFLTDNVQEGARVITDGWPSYPPATAGLYVHERLVGSGSAETAKLLPGVHTVAALAKRWLLGTHQGRVDEAHLAGYLNEFVFRFNRRRSRSRGLVFHRVLELAVAHDPVRYRDLILNPGRRTTRPLLPPTTRGKPASLERPPANRPWRATSPLYSG